MGGGSGSKKGKGGSKSKKQARKAAPPTPAPRKINVVLPDGLPSTKPSWMHDTEQVHAKAKVLAIAPGPVEGQHTVVMDETVGIK